MILEFYKHRKANIPKFHISMGVGEFQYDENSPVEKTIRIVIENIGDKDVNIYEPILMLMPRLPICIKV
ncbi:MAG: hypothetical protein IPP71_19405 [Bacteroidetes bacterium]|nr:hypothetical protein [Bacteroidota bacterium]